MRKVLEARVGIEPTHKGFADLSLTTWVPRPCSIHQRSENIAEHEQLGNKILERETGFEPATSTLARSHSTTELLPLDFLILPHPRPPANLKRRHHIWGCVPATGIFVPNAFHGMHPSLTSNLFLTEGVHGVDTSCTECGNIGREGRHQQDYGRHNEIESRLIHVQVEEKRAEQSG
jgi:hypothetical protein